MPDRRTTIEFPDPDLKWKIKEIAIKNRVSMQRYIVTAVLEKMEREGEKFHPKGAANGK